ncbi:MAG TPA: ATP-grasp domain-containing protein [bacterium]|nr:ATP-grasp domain-containing protein [bacterium]HPJ71126.1 ATP-grasp domain-containing protein [bacterium]HPQ66446.1 ATP-grasp domain-containing protein [bacterium]
MNRPNRVLVVGTTPDYIDWLRRARPGRGLYLTLPGLREKAWEPRPEPDEELLCAPDDLDRTSDMLKEHLLRHGLKAAGVVAYDCEYLEAAAHLALRLGLEYHDPEAVRNCRSKLASKRLWEAAGIRCPRCLPVAEFAEALSFMELTGGRCVLKPLGGTGSELVFKVEDETDCRAAFQEYRRRLPGKRVLAEEVIEGEEYSCDFLMKEGKAAIVRVTRKHLYPGEAFGTAWAYELGSVLPEACREEALAPLAARAASVVGIGRGICMLDFIVGPEGPVLLELAPRPGGSCLPFLLRAAVDLDTVTLAFDHAEGLVPPRFPTVPPHMIGLCLLARRPGILETLDVSGLAADRRVRAVEPLRRPGTRIELPPRDYDTWTLAYAAYRPDPGIPVERQNRQLEQRLEVTLRAE